MGNPVRTKTYSEALWDLEQRMSRLESMLGVGVSDALARPRTEAKRMPDHLSSSHLEPMPAAPPIMPPPVMPPPVMPPPMPVRRSMMEIPQPIIPAYAPPP